jgi:hypothetical protein
MIGIPFEIRRSSDRGAESETIYLRSRRRGPEGEKMRAAIALYRRSQMDQVRLATKVGSLTQRFLSAMGEAPVGLDLASSRPDSAALETSQREALEAAGCMAERAICAAEEIARLALIENHGADTERIVDGLTDRELHAIVATIEQGAMPKDFFPLPGTQPSASATSPSGESPARPLPPPATPGPKSNPDTSTSKTA